MRYRLRTLLIVLALALFATLFWICDGPEKPKVTLPVAVAPIGRQPQALAQGIVVETTYDGVPITMRLPSGWSWDEGGARAYNLYNADPRPPFFIVPLDGSRHAMLSFDSDERPDEDQSAGDVARRILTELSQESNMGAEDGTIIRDRKVILVDGIEAALEVSERTNLSSIEATCRVRVHKVDLTMVLSYRDTRSTCTPADFDQAHAEFHDIVQSIRWVNQAERP